jgi:hypothetical protein
MNEIDQSEVLPRGVVFVTPERLAKGDIAVGYNDNGQLVEAKAVVNNILKYLWDEEYITDQQHHDACTLQIWRDMHQTQMGTRKATSSGCEEEIGIRLRAHGYILLLKRLSLNHQKVIELALETKSTDHTRFVARNNKRAYQIAMERLSTILPIVKEQITYLEGLDEVQSNELSEENLKKLVEQFVKVV